MLKKHLYVDAAIQHGKPCVNGTRTPVFVILEALATGMTFPQIEKEFSPVSTKDIQACILYAALLADDQELLSPSSL